MIKELIAGGNSTITEKKILIRFISLHPVDISCYCLYEDGKVKADEDMIFYGQKSAHNNSIVLIEEGTHTQFSVGLDKLPSNIQKVAFAFAAEDGKKIVDAGSLTIQIETSEGIAIRSSLVLAGRSEAALILGEFYRRNEEWKFRCIDQGFNGGLKPLAEYFGVSVEDEQPASDATESRTTNLNNTKKTESSETDVLLNSRVNLSKISLTKQSPTVNLNKKTDYGLIKVNLNWNQSPQNEEAGFFNKLLNGNGKIDLDLGAFIRLKEGDADIVQALGNRFGSLERAPFVKLLADDRTGASISGEWLHINGEKWQYIDEILIFTFIYEGAPNWSKTDGIVTLHIPNELPIETVLNEGNNRSNMCAIARITNKNGSMQVERVNQYFSGHKQIDEAFGWGFRWKAGSK